MAEVVVGGVRLAYDRAGAGPPVLLLAGCGAPAVSWQLGVAPALVAAGYGVVTVDHRGMAPSDAPPAPYSVSDMAVDAAGLLEHLALGPVCVAGHSMGGWVAEVLAVTRPELVRAVALLGSANPPTAWERAVTEGERDLAAAGTALPPLVAACQVLRYLPTAELQDDAVVAGWLALLAEEAPWENPGRLGQLEACLAWSSDPDRSRWWGRLGVPALVMAFEHDIDSPPVGARVAARAIAGAEYVELAGAGHLAPLTHAAAVAAALVDFFARV